MEQVADVGVENLCDAERRAAKVQERLQRRHESRAKDAERRREDKESHTVAEEQGEYFSSTFAAERASIEELLSRCTGVERSVGIERLEEATAKTAQLQKFLNDSTMFLTPHVLEKAQTALQKIQARFAEIKEELVPKKRFAFRSRTKAADSVSAAAAASQDTPSPAAASAAGSVNQVDGAAAPEQCGFSNMDGVYLTKTGEDIHRRDVLLSHLTNCRVRLHGSPSTLHLKHIDSCEILCGPVSSSVFVDQCKNSTLAFPCQQLRTHNTTDTQVYLHVTSRAIIEDCHGVGFAPFTWSYPSLAEDFTSSGLDRERNNWNQVDDFNWLAAGTPSPNWTVILEADRKTSWD